MKKLVIFESTLILFFVLAWNISKADPKLDKDFCKWIKADIKVQSEVYALNFESYLKSIGDDAKYLDEIIQRDTDRIYKLSTIWKNLCD
jgi:hypothetical protein